MDPGRVTIGAVVNCLGYGGAAPNYGSFALDGATDAVEFICQSPDATPITRLGFRYTLRTGTPPTYKISLQGVGATGNPDGTIKGGASAVSATFTPPADATWDATWRWITLDYSYTPARGEMLSVVIAYHSGTIDGSNCSTFLLCILNFVSRIGCPYAIENAAGARTRKSDLPVFGVGAAASATGFPVKTIYLTQISSNTTPDEQALAFSLPVGFCSTYKVLGIRIGGYSPAAGKTVVVTLYDGTTPLQQMTWDADVGSNVENQSVMRFLFDEATLSTLNAGTTYRIGFAPQEILNYFSMHGLTADAAADLSAYPLGTAWYLSTRTDSGAWNDDTTTRPIAELILDDITFTAGGGGAVGPWGTLR